MTKPSKNTFIFSRTNYLLLIISVLMIALGYVIMSLDDEPFGFGFFGLTLGPIVVFVGFMLVFAAILYKEKKSGQP